MIARLEKREKRCTNGAIETQRTRIRKIKNPLHQGSDQHPKSVGKKKPPVSVARRERIKGGVGIRSNKQITKREQDPVASGGPGRRQRGRNRGKQENKAKIAKNTVGIPQKKMITVGRTLTIYLKDK